MNKQQCKEGNRICIKCKTEKPLTNEYFYKDKNRLAGFMYRCIECDKKRTDPRSWQERWNRMSDAQKARSKKYKEKYAKGDMGRAISTLKAYQKFDHNKGFGMPDIDRFFVFSARESLCVYCGWPATGLDRKDNKLGHTIANCVPCCKECNSARMDNFNQEEMLSIGETIRHLQSRREFKEFNNCVL